MSARIYIGAMVYMIVQAVMFGVGTVLILATPLNTMAMRLMPWMVVMTCILSLPITWLIAPRLRARYWHARGATSDFISG